jgi:hypothetical protein
MGPRNYSCLKTFQVDPSYMGEEALVGRGVINRFETVLDGFVKLL